MPVISHLLFFYLVVVEPVTGILQYRKLVERLKVDPGFKIPFYLRTIILEWVLVVVTIAALAPLILNLPGLIGLQLPKAGSTLLLLGLLTVAIIGIIAMVILARSAKGQEALASSEESALALLPNTRRERRIWVALSITAGVCEELLYRGFVILYLSFMIPSAGVALPLLVSSIIFGVAHAYQGCRGIIATGLLGAGLGGLYVFSGSLIPSMLIHALVDLRVLWVRRPKVLQET
jgi:hypothetical protein